MQSLTLVIVIVSKKIATLKFLSHTDTRLASRTLISTNSHFSSESERRRRSRTNIINPQTQKKQDGASWKDHPQKKTKKIPKVILQGGSSWPGLHYHGNMKGKIVKEKSGLNPSA